jgi:hypothetical protein
VRFWVECVLQFEPGTKGPHHGVAAGQRHRRARAAQLLELLQQAGGAHLQWEMKEIINALELTHIPPPPR